jgi:hypothetical protein
MADWASDKGLNIEVFLSASEAERIAMIESIAKHHYVKGKTENFLRQLRKPEVWTPIRDSLVGRAQSKKNPPVWGKGAQIRMRTLLRMPLHAWQNTPYGGSWVCHCPTCNHEKRLDCRIARCGCC